MEVEKAAAVGLGTHVRSCCWAAGLQRCHALSHCRGAHMAGACMSCCRFLSSGQMIRVCTQTVSASSFRLIVFFFRDFG